MFAASVVGPDTHEPIERVVLKVLTWEFAVGTLDCYRIRGVVDLGKEFVAAAGPASRVGADAGHAAIEDFDMLEDLTCRQCRRRVNVAAAGPDPSGQISP